VPSQQWELFSGNTTTGDTRLVSFKITDGVKVYGGFLGTETAISQRINFSLGQANETILSGDLAADDNVSNTFPSLAYNNYGENAYHVVYTYGVSSQTLVDGFTITSGAATGTGNAQDGGGWYNSGRPGASAPVIKNVIFYRNTATNGGGIYNWGQFDSAIPTLLNCQFIQNLANAGGGMYNFALSGGSTIPELVNTVFYQNSAGFNGGAVYNNGNNFTGTARVEITNCSFFQNITTNFSSSGAAIYNLGSSGTGGDDIINIQNSIFWQNTSTDGTGIPYINTWENSNEALLNVSYSLVPETNVVLAGYTGTTIGAGMLYTADPLFVDTDNSDFRLFDNSPAANLANQALLPNVDYNFDGTLRSNSVLDYDILGDMRVQDGQLNMGATETVVSPPSILITSISPTSAPAGTEVTISGSMFNPSGPNDIFFGPVKVTVNANSAGTEILVNVPAGASSVTPVIVRNNSNGQQASSINSSTPFFTLTVPGPLPLTNTRFSTTQYSSSIQSNAIAAGDFDNDGDADIIIADRTNVNNVIQFQENDGNGVFSTGANTALASGEVRNLQVADFDGDGNLDIAAGKNGGLELFQGNGDGTFTAFPSPAIFSTVISDKAGLAIADINKDGKLDIVCSNISDEVSVLIGDGAGNFAHASYSPFIPTGLGDPSALDVADFNNDGFLDIAILDYNNNQGHIMLFNDAADLFDAPISFATGSRPFRLVTGYFNGDTNMDLAILNITSPAVEIYSGDGAGNFSASGSPVAMGNTPFGLNRGNFDGNSTTDLVIGGGNQANFQLLQGNGTGAVSSFNTFPLNVSPSRPYGVISADFNNDGIADLAGGDLSGAGFNVAIWVRPVITSFTPAYANATETITITGEDFTGVTDVSFGGTPAQSFVFVSDTEITAVVAAGSTSGAVAVTTADGTATLDGFMFSPFVTTWVTDNGSIIIPTSGGGYNYDVAWSNLTNPGTGEGSLSGRTGNTTIFGLANTDVYEVRISGVFPRINFGGSTFQNQQKIRSIEQWGNNPWTSMEGAFNSCRNMVINAADTPDLSNVTSLSSMFVGVREANAFTNTDLSTWDVSTITDMSYLFNFAWFFNQDISNWDVSNVTNMAYMFGGAYAYNQPLNSWDVSNVINMELMFFELDDFNQPLDQWDVSNVQFMNGMFSYTKAFDQPLNNWNVSSVTTMQEMFGGAEVFNQPLDLWDVSSVTDMSLMFENANVVAFNQPLDTWDVSNVTQMWSMFSYNDIFNQDISGWDVSNVTDMWSMFREATAFNQNLGNWDVSNVFDMGSMLDNSGLSIANYDSTLVGWASLPSLQASVTLGAGSLTYCQGETARNSIVSTYSWTINDAGPNCLPAITSFTPVSAAFGESVTITGENFLGTSTVTFGGVNASSYTINNASTITAVVSSGGASGAIDLTTVEGSATLSGFQFIPPPTISTFNPASAAQGETVTLTGTNFTNATAVSFGATAPSSFTVVSDTEITAIIGAGSSGNIMVSTPGGTITQAGFTFIPAPSIASFSPTSAAQGETVSIMGSNFTNASAVSFGGTSATSFTVVSDTEITAVVGNGSSGNLEVTTPGGTVTIANFTFINAPVVDSFSPATAAQGENITIIGSDFTGATAVSFGGTPATSYTVVSDTEITAVVGNGSSGNLEVTTPGGTVTIANFTFINAPVVDSFSPATAAQGETITIIGTDFTGATAVTFGGTPAASFTVVSDTEITAVVGNGSSGNIEVTTPGGNVTIANFTFINAPVVDSFSPATAAQGETITIIGTDFTDATAVTFGGTPAASFTVVSDTEITAIVGNGSSGNIEITTPGGTVTIANFTFINAPAIDSFSPATAAQGETISIIGTDFTGATAVTFGGIPASSFTVVSDTEITAIVGNGSSGNIEVSAPGGTFAIANFTFINAPVVDSFSPATAAQGESITIIGTDFTDATSVTFGGTPASTFTVVSDTEITAVVGNGSSGNIEVITPGGSITLAGFTFIPAPSIASFSPTSATEGTTVTIIGSNFTDASIVTFGGTSASSFTVVSNTEITAVVGNGGTGNILVETPGGSFALGGFTFIPAVSIASFSPTSAAQGTTVTIIGSNFTDATMVNFGGTAAASFTIVSDTEISAIVGSGSSGDVVVTTTLGTSSLEGFTFLFSQMVLFQSEDNRINNNQSELVNLGSVLAGESLNTEFIIFNSGNTNLQISNIFSSNEAFEVTSLVNTINPESSAKFTIQFTAIDLGSYESEIRIINNSTNSPDFIFTVTAESTGLNIIDNETESVIISNQDINLGTTLINVNVDKDFNIENLSPTAEIIILSITVDNPVFQIVNIPTSIPPSSSVVFTVRLNADEVGEYKGIVTVRTNVTEFSFQVAGIVLPQASTEIKVFNVITPNGDGRHDFLQIENITEYPNNIVSIFNRWGNKVFEINNYNNIDRIFEGTSDNGEELYTGNYYYVIDKGNGENRQSGFLIIKR
jgi:gliding motility-associated-like protein